MKRHSSLLLIVSLAVTGMLGGSGLAFGQDAPAVVTIKENAQMLSLKDDKQIDTYTANLSDSQVITDFLIKCTPGSAGHLGGLFGRSEMQCSVGGSGKIVNPKNPSQQVHRTDYGGALKVDQDGSVDASLMNISYSPSGQTNFSGLMTLKPEHPSPTAQSLTASLLDKFNKDKKAGEVIDERTDTIALSNFCTPSAGFPADKGTCWSGDGVFSYQKSAWYFNLKATFNGKDYPFKGNMPWIDDSATTPDQVHYDVSLMLADPSNQSTDALFADANDPGSLFATQPGIAGTWTMKEGGYTDYKVQGQVQSIPYLLDVSGQLTGTQVPLEVVRSFSTLGVILSRTLLGP